MALKTMTTALLLAASLTGQHNPIENGGFEAGFEGWTFGSDSGSTWKIEQRNVGLKKDKALVLNLKRATSGTTAWIERTLGIGDPKKNGGDEYFFRFQAQGTFQAEIRVYYPPGPPNDANTFAFFYTSHAGVARTVTGSHPNTDSARPDENYPCRIIFWGEGEVVIDDLAFVGQTPPAMYDDSLGLCVWTDYITSRQLNALVWASPVLLAKGLIYRDQWGPQDWWLPPSLMVLVGHRTNSTPIPIPEFMYPYFGQLHFQAMTLHWSYNGDYLSLGAPYTVTAWH